MPTIVLGTLMAATIVAILDRGARQAWAVGFAVAFLLFAAASLTDEKHDPYTQLLTNQLTSHMYNAVGETVYVDVKLDIDSRVELSRDKLPPGADILGVGESYMPDAIGVGQVFSSITRPRRPYFDSVAYGIWALLFGYVGGNFGRWVYVRRVREKP